MKNNIKKILLICLFLVSSLNASNFIGASSVILTVITHPMEVFDPTIVKNGKGQFVEEQHIIQKHHGGKDKKNISPIPASSHSVTDRWNGLGVWGQGKVWDNNISEDGWGLNDNSENNLAQAYKLGRWQLEPTFFLYDYKTGNWTSTLFEWDGMSHLVYMIDWIINTPSKYLRKTAYLISPNKAEKDKHYYKLLIDQALQIPVLVIEGVCMIVYNTIGIVTGTIFHPIDTIASVIGGIWFIIKGIFGGLIDFFLTLFLLFKSIF